MYIVDEILSYVFQLSPNHVTDDGQIDGIRFGYEVARWLTCLLSSP